MNLFFDLNTTKNISLRFVSILFLLSIHSWSMAQQAPANVKYFDPQPENFMKQLGVLFKENAHEELETVYAELEKEFKAKKINDYQLTKMCDILNIMYNRKMNVYPEYRNFITATIAATRSGYDEKFQDRWYLFVKGILENAKKGNNKDFKIFIDFSNDLFQYNALVADKSKTFQIETKDLNFSYENGKILVRVPLTNLKAYFRVDTTVIYNTSGKYNIMEKIWEGQGGSSNWTRVGMSPAEANVSFGGYKIDMSKPSYSIDSAKLVFPEYFSTPIYGKFTDMITKEIDTSKLAYPQFSAYANNFIFNKKVSPNVNVRGGFQIKGKDIVVGSEFGTFSYIEVYDKAQLTKKILTAEGVNCVFKKGDFVKMNSARVKLYFGTDSITHPQTILRYDVAKNEITILRDDVGSGKARYRSTYHKMSFDAEMVTWKLDDDHMDLKMLVGKGNNAAKFISENNFDQETYNLARTAAVESDPLSTLSKMSNNGTDAIPLDAYIASFGSSFSAASVLPAVFSLEKDGFVSYNAIDKTIKVNKELVDFYMKAQKKKIDYDLLRFKGYGDNFVGRLYTNSKKIEAEKVYKIPFNDSTFVYAYPSTNKRLEITDNRHLKFNGKVLGGRLDFYGSGFDFRYDSFSIKSDSISKITIGYPVKKDKETGEEVLEPLKSSIEKVKGELYINAKFNKSGKESARMYPKMATYDKSYVYYDHSNIYNGKYNREDFYFELTPFKKDSLLYFEPSNLFYDGKLYSAKIFEPFSEKLRIQSDLSLGFITQTPANGFSNYQGKGTFTGSLRLSNAGLVGKGDLKHLTTTLSSDSILYFPNQTNLFAHAVEMKEQKGAVEFPQMSSDSTLVEWRPYADSMLLASTKKNPFDMFQNTTKMHGILVLEGKGLTGHGFLDFDEAKITADNMKFKTTTMSADTSSMEIKNLGNKVTFKTPNVKCFMNFETKIGDFKSNATDISTNFAYNQYKAEINEFRWDITKKILTFKAKEGTIGSKFTSTHPLQDSLSFYCKIAEYNMLSSIIKMDGVEEILVADSRIIPDNGKVNIFPEAKMEILKNATIEGDTANVYHSFTSCAIDVHGKYDILGHGEYILKVNNQDFPIKLNSIKVAKQLLHPEKRSRKELYQYTIEGTGKVEKSQNLKIYRNTDFHGNVHIFMNKKFPHFEGMQRIEFTNPSYKTPWFAVDNEINVAELSMYKKELKAEDEKQLYTGFLIDRDKHNGIYTSFLAPKKGDSDQIMFDARGTIKHLPADNHYLFGDSARILGGASKGEKMDYSDAEGKVVAEGKMNPKLKIGGIPLLLGGFMQNDLNDNSYKFIGNAGMNITLDKDLSTVLTNFIITEFATNKDIFYPKKESMYAMSELVHPKDMTSFQSEIEKSGSLLNGPKYSPFNIIFSDLVLDYVNDDIVYRSKPEFGVSVFGGRPINKLTNGFIEMGYGELFDYFTIYMKAKSRAWIFITYSDGQLSILTSDEFVNNAVNKLEPRKRIVKKSATEFYNYTLAGQYEVESFVKRMGKGGKYNSEERRPAPTPDNERVSEKELKNTEIIEDKTPEIKELEQKEKEAVSAEDAELKALEAELKALEEEKEKIKKAAAEKALQLEEFSNENKNAPNIEAPAPKKEETPAPPVETPSSEPQSSPKDEEGKEIIPTGDRERPEETPEDKKKAEPEKKEAGQSLFDSYF